jgi:hypothetical protein
MGVMLLGMEMVSTDRIFSYSYLIYYLLSKMFRYFYEYLLSTYYLFLTKKIQYIYIYIK